MDTASVGYLANGALHGPSLIANGGASRSLANRLLSNGMDHNCLRPYIGDDGRNYLTRMVTNQMTGERTPQSIVTNADATLRIREWITLDAAVTRAATAQLRLFNDLRGAGLSYSIPNAMAYSTFEYQTQSNITGATVSMDGLRKSEQDRPEYDTNGMPLPIIHKDFSFSARQIQESRNRNTPLDTTMAELAAVRVAEQIEQMTAGTVSAYTYGGYPLYGYINAPSRLTGTQTYLPTNGSWTPNATLLDVLQMKLKARQHYYYGPWVLYCGIGWDPYMDDDYKSTNASSVGTLRMRLKMIENIKDVRTTDWLNGTNQYALLLVPQDTRFCRAVIGMDVTTLQWEEQGGLELCFKVMAMLYAQVRSDFNQNTGLVHYAQGS